MSAILVELCCYDWISGDISRVTRVYGNRHRNSRRASGGDRLRAHPENYAAITATHLRFPCNGLCSLDRFRFIIRTLWPKQVRLLIRHYLLLKLHCRPLYIAPCITIQVPTYDDAPLVVSRYLDRDTIRVKPAQVSRCIDVSLRPYFLVCQRYKFE